MKTYKDLPPGSQAWAAEMTAVAAEVKALKDVVRRLSGNASLDMSNPQRGINSGNAPSVQPTVGQKISSLADVSSYNVLDGQVLTWSQQEQKWLPKTRAGGGSAVVPADTWSFQQRHNYAINPGPMGSTVGWTLPNYPTNLATMSVAPGAGYGGHDATVMTPTGTNHSLTDGNWIVMSLPTEVKEVHFWYKANKDVSLIIYVTLYDGTNDTNTSAVQQTGGSTTGLTSSAWQQITVANPSNSAKTLTLALGNEGLASDYDGLEILYSTVMATESDSSNYFDGFSSNYDGFSFVWEGTPNASVSRSICTRKIRTPGVITIGKDFQVIGTGFLPGEAFTISEGNWGIALVTGNADATGSFDVVANIAAGQGPTAGADNIVARLSVIRSGQPKVFVTLI